MVEKGFTQYAKIKTSDVLGASVNYEANFTGKKLKVFDPAKDPKEVPITSDEKCKPKIETVQSSAKVEEKHDVGSKPKKYSSVKEKIEKIAKLDKEIPKIELSDKDKKILRKLELEHEKKIHQKAPSVDDQKVEDEKEAQRNFNLKTEEIPENSAKPDIKPSIKPRQTVSKLFIFHFD